ncbi:hypothetical protein [Rhizobium sp. RU36D]|uniref:hypothetical protein n=1 Tax=Rhizobium sp. RU36D TaxID=1907415 RepID=UPI0015C4C1C9|nr:hypothetical protein [Rhizobium sp. RU36D]
MTDKMYFYDAAGDLIIDAERQVSRSSDIKPGKSADENADVGQTRQAKVPEQPEARAA